MPARRGPVFHARRQAVWLAGAMLAGVAAAGKGFIIKWVGPEFTESFYVLLILAGGQYFDMVFAPALNYARGIDRQKRFALAALIEGILVLLIAFPAAQYGGIIGVAITVALTTTLAKMFYWSTETKRISGVSRREILQPKILGFLVALPFVAAGYWGNLDGGGDGSWLRVFLVGVGMSLAYIVVFGLLNFSRTRAIIRPWLRGASAERP